MIKIICDSMSDLPLNILEKYDIDVIPLTVIFNGTEYLDGETLTKDEFYKMLRETDMMPKTSQATYVQFKSVFEKYDNPDTEVIYIAGSSVASGTYQSATLAKSDGHDNVTLFDTKNVAIGSALFVIKACEMAKKGHPVEEIISTLEKFRDEVEVVFSVDTLEYLKRGGRLGKTTATLGELISLKPIISSNDEGLLFTYCKARGRKQALSKVKQIILSYLDKGKCSLWILQGNALKDGYALLEELKSHPNLNFISLETVGPSMGVHTGPNVVGFAILEEA